MFDIPTLKRLENGSTGEARTKELLIDRFWILERSVDVQGADFIIQRKLLDRNILDKNPPKFGIVQAKFIQDDKTNIYIDKDYICDNDGDIRKEFFLLIHTGKEDTKRAFFLDASDIVKKYEVVIINKKQMYYISGKKLFSDKEAHVNSISYVNDKIENLLIKADFLKNRLFINWYTHNNIEIDINALDYEYCLDIGNNYYPLPNVIYDYKVAAKKVLEKMSETIHYLQEIIEETNAETIIEYLDYLNADMCETNSNKCLGFYCNDLELHDDAKAAFEEHKLILDNLKKNNKLQIFVAIKKQLKDIITKEFNKNMKEKDTLFNMKCRCLIPPKESKLRFKIIYSIIMDKFNIEYSCETIDSCKENPSEFVVVNQYKNQNIVEINIDFYWRYLGNVNSAKTFEENIFELYHLFSRYFDNRLVEILVT